MFTKEDFTQENAERLRLITNHKMLLPLMTPFYSLAPTMKTKFNRIMNEYISTLGEDWNTKLLSDFNTLVTEELLNENFDPSKQFIKEMNTDRQILYSPEQEQWIKEETEAGRPPVI
jgi:hypothetical protein